MFGNNQDDQSNNNNTSMDQVAQEIGGDQNAPAPTPNFGLGTNPSAFSPTEPTVALPTPLPPSHIAEPDENSVSAQDNQPVSSPDSPPPVSGDLEEIKNQALGQLSPLVGKLDQSPEEKYKTLMMMIQASDNRDLIKDAYAAANAITDEKVKAEALLSIVNEINYFTQQSHN